MNKQGICPECQIDYGMSNHSNICSTIRIVRDQNAHYMTNNPAEGFKVVMQEISNINKKLDALLEKKEARGD